MNMRHTEQETAVIKEQQKDQIESERRSRKEKEAEESVNAGRDDGTNVTDFLLWDLETSADQDTKVAQLALKCSAFCRACARKLHRPNGVRSGRNSLRS